MQIWWSSNRRVINESMPDAVEYQVMKVGVLPFHAGPNHGAFLQAYERVRAIKNLGHECEIIGHLDEGERRAKRFTSGWI